MAADMATGSNVAGALVDRISNFENAKGGSLGDDLYGSAAANTLDGGDGSDHLFGFGGNDTLIGGAGYDLLAGGAGKDILTGGAVEGDNFYFSAKTDSGVTAATRDVITDFEDGVDIIEVFDMDADTTTVGNQDFTWTGTNVPFGGSKGELRAYWSGNGQIIEGDLNGDKVADFSIKLIDPTHVIFLSDADFLL